MPAQQEGVSGLWWNWNSGDGIKNQMDSNLRKIGVQMQIRIQSRSLTTPPASPADGACYIVPSGTTAWPATGVAGDVAVWRANTNAWEYYTPYDGWVAVVISEGTWGTMTVFKGGDWSPGVALT